MKRNIFLLLTLATILITSSSCGRRIRTAEDITPGNIQGERLDWRYGATDIRIQTTKVLGELMDRWDAKAEGICNTKPRIVITQIDNRTDCYISTDMIRDIFEGAAVDDGRFTIVVGDLEDEKELDQLMQKITYDSKYTNRSKLQNGQALAPQFLAKVRITKAVTSDRRFDFEDYRMTVSLYDIKTQEVVDSAWDVLSKRVQGCCR